MYKYYLGNMATHISKLLLCTCVCWGCKIRFVDLTHLNAFISVYVMFMIDTPTFQNYYRWMDLSYYIKVTNDQGRKVTFVRPRPIDIVRWRRKQYLPLVHKYTIPVVFLTFTKHRSNAPVGFCVVQNTRVSLRYSCVNKTRRDFINLKQKQKWSQGMHFVFKYLLDYCSLNSNIVFTYILVERRTFVPLNITLIIGRCG